MFMFQNGDLVIYGIHGVCRIVGREDRVVDRKKLNTMFWNPWISPALGIIFLLITMQPFLNCAVCLLCRN